MASVTEWIPFEGLFQWDVYILRFLGLFSMKRVFSGEALKPSVWESVPFAFGIFQITFIALFEFRNVCYFWSRDRDVAFAILSSMLSGVLCLTKGIRLWQCRAQLYNLLYHLHLLWENSESRIMIKEEIVRKATGTKIVRNYYASMVVTLCFSYVVRPGIVYLIFCIRGKNESYDFSQTGYPTLYPFIIESGSAYITCLFCEHCSVIFVILYWISSDVLFTQLTTHVSIQFQVLAYDITNIVGCNDFGDEKAERKLSSIIKRHTELIEWCKCIETIYNPIIFLTMILTAANLCFCVYQLEKELSVNNVGEVVKYISHILTLFIGSYIYCGYADTLMWQSGSISDAAYQCKWYHQSKNFQHTLQMIILRGQKNVSFTSYGFFKLDLHQITRIANTTASFFALLKSMS